MTVNNEEQDKKIREGMVSVIQTAIPLRIFVLAYLFGKKRW